MNKKLSGTVPFVGLDRQFLNLEEELVSTFKQIGRSGNYVLGNYLCEFESEFARLCGVKYAVGVGTGSDAIFLILKALGIGFGDEVITCPNSFIATAWTVVATGAKPVFVDARDDLNINPEKIMDAVTNKTKAIIPVHLAGRPADMIAINKIAAEKNIHVIEDAAQSIGASLNGKPVGSFGIAAGFSLHPLKNLGLLGDGGIITTNSPQLYSDIKKLRNHGLLNRDDCVMWGFNSRLDEIQAAFALIKLKHLDKWNKKNREVADFYSRQLRSVVEVPKENIAVKPVFHNYIVQTDQREELARFLDQHGISTRIHYPIPIHLQSVSKDLGYTVGSFPVIEKQAKRILSLPIFPELKKEELKRVVDTIISFFNRG